MRTTRKDTQRQTRDRLMAAAHASIVKEGVVAMSIRNICGAAGHSQGAFYSNFASKGDLLVEITQSHIQDEVTLMRDLWSPATATMRCWASMKPGCGRSSPRRSRKRSILTVPRRYCNSIGQGWAYARSSISGTGCLRIATFWSKPQPVTIAPAYQPLPRRWRASTRPIPAF